MKSGLYDRQDFNLFAYHGTDPKIDHSVFHFHNNYELMLCLKGRLTMYIGQTRYEMGRGSVFAINTEEVHKVVKPEGEEYERYIIHFSPSVVRPLMGLDVDLMACFCGHEPGENNAAVLDEAQMEEFSRIFGEIDRVLKVGPYGKEVLKTAYLAQLLTLASQAFYSADPAPAKHASDLVTVVMDYVERHLGESISLNSVASDLFMDKFYLSHQFKKMTGDSLYHFILMRRIALARRLLGQGKSVGEVCERTGFNNYNNFIRTFRKYVEMAPGEYRNYLKQFDGTQEK